MHSLMISKFITMSLDEFFIKHSPNSSGQKQKKLFVTLLCWHYCAIVNYFVSHLTTAIKFIIVHSYLLTQDEAV